MGAENESDYAELKRRVREAGLLERQPWWYVLSLGINTLLLCLCLMGLARFQLIWFQVFAGIALAFVSGQLAFQVHDAGHHQMFAWTGLNRLVGFLTLNGLLGASFAWWIDDHTRHHAHPNHWELDPDLDNGVTAFSAQQALSRPWPLRWIVKYQAVLFVPLACLYAWSAYVNSILYLARHRFAGRKLEAIVLTLHAAATVWLLVHLVGPWSALLVIAVQRTGTGLYLGLVFATNHQGMPQLAENVKLDYLRRQVLTTRNLRGGLLTDLLYGSLNLQIEHHLFPRMTRLNLRRARPIVKQFCAELGVPYYETSVAQSYRELLRFLHRVGEPLRQAKSRVPPRPQPAQ